MRTFTVSLMLFMLSIGFVMVMDLMFLKISLKETLGNILIPFRSMMNEEVVLITLIILYMVTKPVVVYFMKKKKT